MSVIECHNITKKYKNKNALNKLSLNIAENKIVGFIGNNGAGKTTFMQMCAGHIKPTSGDIKIFGESILNTFRMTSKTVFIDENIYFNSSYRLKDILNMAKIFYLNWNDKLAKELIDFYKLNLKQKYKRLSRGLKTKVNIMIALCSNMPLTLFDEPTLGLDSASRKDLYKILLRDYMNKPRSIIIASHLLSEIENLLEEIILINDGKLVLHDSINAFQNYGVELSGNNNIVQKFTKSKIILASEYHSNIANISIKNTLTPADHVFLKQNNITVKKIEIDDICNYLISKKGEEISEL